MSRIVLEKIKNEIFLPLARYKKDFPEFAIPQLFKENKKKSNLEVFNFITNNLKPNQDLLVLIYVPFCCYQCVFCRNKYFLPNQSLIKKYISNLAKEIKTYAKLGIFKKNKIKAIYFGGGTPTVLPFQDISRILELINSSFNVDAKVSVTCETHPVFLSGQQAKKRLKIIKDCGINRISIGAQSLDNRVLKLNKRGHSDKEVFEAVDNANEKRIFINLDMMIGLPGQDIDSIKGDLMKLEKTKFSWLEYMRHDIINQKAIEILNKNPDLFADNNALFEMNMIVQDWLERNNYERNGCFDKPSESSFPYRAYWLNETPYISFGPVAHSHLGGICFYNQSNLEDYFSLLENNQLPIKKYRVLSLEEQIFRTFFLHLQTKVGVDMNELRLRFGEDYSKILSRITSVLKSYNLVIQSGDRLKLTAEFGRYFFEDISCLIIQEAENLLIK